MRSKERDQFVYASETHVGVPRRDATPRALLCNLGCGVTIPKSLVCRATPIGFPALVERALGGIRTYESGELFVHQIGGECSSAGNLRSFTLERHPMRGNGHVRAMGCWVSGLSWAFPGVGFVSSRFDILGPDGGARRLQSSESSVFAARPVVEVGAPYRDFWAQLRSPSGDAIEAASVSVDIGCGSAASVSASGSIELMLIDADAIGPGAIQSADLYEATTIVTRDPIGELVVVAVKDTDDQFLLKVGPIRVETPEEQVLDGCWRDAVALLDIPFSSLARNDDLASAAPAAADVAGRGVVTVLWRNSEPSLE